MGHQVQSELSTDPDGPTYTATMYDGLGRPYQVYNPTRCGTPTTNCGELTWGYSTYAYDALGRTTSVTEQDSQLVTTVYSGNCATVTDEALHARKSCSDALGRLTQVFEDPNNLNYETIYTYDALDDLVTVNQRGGTTNPAAWRVRNFHYDSRARLTSSSNPESGTATYSYDLNGNLSYKTSPAPNQTGSATVTLTYCYDQLNRLTAKAYTQQTCSNGTLPSPVMTLAYDQPGCLGNSTCSNIGHRTNMTDNAGSESWAYDTMGRAAVDQRTTNGVTFSTPYTYNSDGSIYTEIYPDKSSPETVTFLQGGAGRPVGSKL